MTPPGRSGTATPSFKNPLVRLEFRRPSILGVDSRTTPNPYFDGPSADLRPPAQSCFGTVLRPLPSPRFVRENTHGRIGLPVSCSGPKADTRSRTPGRFPPASICAPFPAAPPRDHVPLLSLFARFVRFNDASGRGPGFFSPRLVKRFFVREGVNPQKTTFFAPALRAPSVRGSCPKYAPTGPCSQEANGLFDLAHDGKKS